MRQGMTPKRVGQISGIIYIAWPPVVENGFLKAMSLWRQNRMA